MDQNQKTIKSDTQSLVLSLTYGENLQALNCAEKIRENLVMHIKDGREDYLENLKIVDQIIAEHRERIADLSEPDVLSHAS